MATLKKTKNDFQDRLLLNAGQKYCRMLQEEHSAILSTFINLSYQLSLKPLFCFFFERPFYTGFTVVYGVINSNYAEKIAIIEEIKNTHK